MYQGLFIYDKDSQKQLILSWFPENFELISIKIDLTKTDNFKKLYNLHGKRFFKINITEDVYNFIMKEDENLYQDLLRPMLYPLFVFDEYSGISIISNHFQKINGID